MYVCAALRDAHRENVCTSCNKRTIHDRLSDKRTDMVPGLFSNILQCHFFCLTVHFVFTVEVVQASKQASMCVCEREREQRFCKRGIIIPFFYECMCNVCVCVCALRVAGCRDG